MFLIKRILIHSIGTIIILFGLTMALFMPYDAVKIIGSAFAIFSLVIMLIVEARLIGFYVGIWPDPDGIE